MMGRPSNETLAAQKAEAEARFNEAVASKVTDVLPSLVQSIMAQLMNAREQAAPVAAVEGVPFVHPQTSDGDKSFASGLALAIANLSAQGTGKQALVPPEVLEGYANARARMTALLVKARAENTTPTYRVLRACYFNETKIEPQWHDPVSKAMKDTEIHWDEVPNTALEPINEIAVQVFSEYLNSIGEAPNKRNEPSAPWVRSENRLFKGMSQEQRSAVYGVASTDPRIAGKGAPLSGKREYITGTVAAPAVVR